MAGKVRRDAIFQQTRRRLRSTVNAHGLLPAALSKIPLTSEEWMAFHVALVRGLIGRLHRRYSKDGELVRKIIKNELINFKYWCAIEGMTKAGQRVALGVALSNSRRFDRHSSLPLELLEEAAKLGREMPDRAHPKQRRDWLSQHGVDPDQANANNAELIEQILCTKYKKSESTIHKLLAQAGRLNK